MAILALSAILYYLAAAVAIHQAFVTTGRRGFFTAGVICSIVGSVSNGGLPTSVSHRWFGCSNLNHSLRPLLGQSYQWRVLRSQALN
jgi:hypothetical protein